MSSIGYELDVQIVGLDEQLKRLGDFGPLLNRHLERGMKKAVIYTASKVVPLVPVGVSGRLRNSIGSEVTVEAIGSVVGKVGSSLKDEEYPAVMEFGRTPGARMPPPEALVRWVHLKGLAGTYSIKSHRRQGGKARQADEDLQVAFVVARSIGRKGIQGRRYMQHGLEAARPNIAKFFKLEMDELVKELAIDGS